MKRIKEPERMFPDYSQNCGICKYCTIPGYLEKNKVVCPKCGDDKVRLDSFNNANGNWIRCEKGNHRYNIREHMDISDVELHQKTIRNKQGFSNRF